MTLDELSGLYTSFDRPIVNRTGITEPVAFRLESEKVEKSGDPPPASLVTAFKNQLGLELRPATGPRVFLVVDHAERPTPDSPAPSRAIGARRR
jgi:uncharacterized protein (TIGR03435 family)